MRRQRPPPPPPAVGRAAVACVVGVRIHFSSTSQCMQRAKDSTHTGCSHCTCTPQRKDPVYHVICRSPGRTLPSHTSLKCNTRPARTRVARTAHVTPRAPCPVSAAAALHTGSQYPVPVLRSCSILRHATAPTPTGSTGAWWRRTAASVSWYSEPAVGHKQRVSSMHRSLESVRRRLRSRHSPAERDDGPGRSLLRPNDGGGDG